MKSKLILGWIIVAFFVYFYKYSVGGYKYRDEFRSNSYKIGTVIGEAIRWPIDIFRSASADTSEIDSKSDRTFKLSIIKIIKERQKYYDPTAYIAVVKALSYCATKEYISIFGKNLNNEQLDYFIKDILGIEVNNDFQELKIKIRRKFDKNDFGDILENGYKCKQELKN